jgi:hypothetical protein
MPTYFKEARKKSDRCEYCDEGRQSIKKLRTILSRCQQECTKHTQNKDKADKDGDREMGEEECESGEERDHLPKRQDRTKEEEEAARLLEECECEETLEQRDREKVAGLRKDVDTWLLHRQYNVEQRLAFKEESQNLAPDEALVLYDYKENVMTHKGPDEKSGDFRRRTPRSVLGIIVYTRKDTNSPVQKEYIGMFSEILSKDGLFSSDNIRNIVLKYCPDKPNILLWSDSGPHFKCKDFMYFALHELPVKHNKKVQLNTFMEKHGKNGVDGFFSLIGRWLKDEETRQAINTTEDFVSALQHRASQSNSDKNTKYTFDIYKRQERPPTYKGITNLEPRTYHSYTSEPDAKAESGVSVKASVLSSDPQAIAIPIKPKIQEFRDDRENKHAYAQEEEKGEKTTLDNLAKVQQKREDVYFESLIKQLTKASESGKSKRKGERGKGERKEETHNWFPTTFPRDQDGDATMSIAFNFDGGFESEEVLEPPTLPSIEPQSSSTTTTKPRKKPQTKPTRKPKKPKKNSVEDAWNGRD